ncbi:PP2C family protein-serine/threonine phosphatase [Nevskia ramosa]|uniref:PP2C family protein-serine/threonine phosphatase n=1 Tax=Nevskia ramosa TaxID=64002 RepID=UPI0023553893|nr:protein phosphatase 2C domain-containing protein [Nevskia ramosa]
MSVFQSAGRTDLGKVRKRNEDAILSRGDARLWVVADGLGGHSAGDVASALIAERLAAIEVGSSAPDAVDAIDDTLLAVHEELRLLAQQRRVDLIGSTVALTLIRDGVGLCGWVGDSRVYCYEGGQLRQLTVDHAHAAPPGMTSQAGAGVLTRAVGADQVLSIDWLAVALKADTQLLLCTDGVNKEMSDQELAEVLGAASSAEAAIDDIFACCLARGARDNVSAIVIRAPV